MQSSHNYSYRIFNDCGFAGESFYQFLANNNLLFDYQQLGQEEFQQPPKLLDMAVLKIVNNLRSGQEALLLDIPVELQYHIKTVFEQPMTVFQYKNEICIDA